MSSGKLPKAIPDQAAKLNYLLHVRRDLWRGKGVTGTSAEFAPPIDNEASLAGALGVNPSKVTRWMQGSRMDDDEIGLLCAIYSVEVAAFLSRSIEGFRELYEYQPPPPDWRTLVRAASAKEGWILHDDPAAADAHPHRYPTIPQMPARAPPEFRVIAGKPFWIEFRSPRTAAGKALWAGRQIMLFCHDENKQGFRCYIPTLRAHPALSVSVFPTTGRPLGLPRGVGFSHSGDDLGAFELVLVTAREAIPESIIDMLSDANAHGSGIEAGLWHAANWLRQAPQDSIALSKVRYSVPPKAHPQEVA